MTGRWRVLTATVGGLAVVVGLLPLGSMDFRVHVVAHLLAAMVGPALIASTAPVTALLRATRGAGRRRLVRVLHSRYARVVGSGPVVLGLEVGGMYVWYLTPLYGIGHRHPWVAVLVHLHMVAAGLLFAWYVLGIDPPARRFAARVAVLVLAAGAHDLLTKLMVAHALPAGHDVRAGAELIYAGGTVVELGLAVVLMAGWYARSGRALRHAARRSAQVGAAGDEEPAAGDHGVGHDDDQRAQAPAQLPGHDQTEDDVQGEQRAVHRAQDVDAALHRRDGRVLDQGRHDEGQPRARLDDRDPAERGREGGGAGGRRGHAPMEPHRPVTGVPGFAQRERRTGCRRGAAQWWDA